MAMSVPPGGHHAQAPRVLTPRALADKTSRGDQLGWSVALSGALGIAGAPRMARKHECGYADEFRRVGKSWRLAKLSGINVNKELQLKCKPSSDFGYSVAVTSVPGGDAGFVGAPNWGGGLGLLYTVILTSKGSTYVAQGGADPYHYLGDAVAFSGKTTILGEDGSFGRSGAVDILLGTPPAEDELAPLKDPDRTPGDQFGESVAVSGASFVVGAPGTRLRAGAAYVFTGSGSHWRMVRLKRPGNGTGGLFGTAVAISGGTIAVGAAGARHDNGLVYIYQRAGTRWKLSAVLSDPAWRPHRSRVRCGGRCFCD